jgi:hypothetical protein
MSELKACPDGGHCNNEALIETLQSEVTRLRGALEEAAEKLSHAPNTNNYDFEKWRLDFIQIKVPAALKGE